MASTDKFIKVTTGDGKIRELIGVGGDSVKAQKIRNFRGNGQTWRIAIFNDDDTPANVSDMATAKAQYQDAFSSESSHASKALTKVANTVTKEGFEGGTEWHYEVEFSDAEMNASLGGNASGNFWLYVGGVTSGGNERTFAAEEALTIVEDGSDAEPGDPPGGGTAITSAEAAALFEAQFGKVYKTTIAAGTKVKSIAFGETLVLPATPCAGVIGAYQATTGETAKDVRIDPDSLTATGVDVVTTSANHNGIVVRVLIELG